MKNNFAALLIIAALSVSVLPSCGTVENVSDSEPVVKTTEAATEETTDASTEAVTEKTAKSTEKSDEKETSAAKTSADETKSTETVTTASEDSEIVTDAAPEEDAPATEADEPAQEPEEPQDTPEETDPPQDVEPATEAPAAGSFDGSSDMYFNGTTVLNSADGLIGSLGAPNSTEEAPSCLNNGCDIKIYRYSGLNVYAYIDGESEIIYEIEVTGSGYSTGKGLSVGSSFADAEALYGTGTVQGGGTHCYYATDTTYMYIIESGGTVTAFGYAAIV